MRDTTTGRSAGALLLPAVVLLAVVLLAEGPAAATSCAPIELSVLGRVDDIGAAEADGLVPVTLTVVSAEVGVLDPGDEVTVWYEPGSVRWLEEGDAYRVRATERGVEAPYLFSFVGDEAAECGGGTFDADGGYLVRWWDVSSSARWAGAAIVAVVLGGAAAALVARRRRRAAHRAATSGRRAAVIGQGDSGG